jgi:hypothetical protein
VTFGWIVFSFVMPAVVVALGFAAVWWNDRYLRQEDEKRNKPGE